MPTSSDIRVSSWEWNSVAGMKTKVSEFGTSQIWNGEGGEEDT